MELQKFNEKSGFWKHPKICPEQSFPPGIYFVHIFSDGANFHRPIKFIKF